MSTATMITKAVPDLKSEFLQTLNLTEHYLLGLETNLKGLKIVDLKDKEGYEKVRTGIAECRSKRNLIDKARLQKTEDYRTATAKINAIAKEIITRLQAVETPLITEKNRIDDEKEKIKEKAKREERERVIKIQKRIDEIRILSNSPDIPHAIATLDTYVITIGYFQEFAQEAESVRQTCLEHLQKRLTDRLKEEQEQAEKAAKKAELEKELQALQAEKEKQATELALARSAHDAAVKKQLDEVASEKRQQALAQLEIEVQREKLQKEIAEKERKEQQEQNAVAQAKLKEKLKPDLEKAKAWIDALRFAYASPPALNDSTLELECTYLSERIDTIISEFERDHLS